MIQLLIVTVVWTFSFGLIKHYLVPMDPYFAAFARMALALLVLAPFYRRRGMRLPAALRFTAIGALQFGVMYVAYMKSYAYLASYEVALLTIFTPLWITLVDGVLTRRLTVRFHLAALVAVIGAAVIFWPRESVTPALTGVLLVQIANFAFGTGQVLYRRAMNAHPELRNREVIGLLYVGACLVTGAAMLLWTDPDKLHLTPTRFWVLIYLGIVAAGAGFFLWNSGARKVSAGVLAVMNNAYMPFVLLAGIFLYGEDTDPLRLAIGIPIIVGALFVNGVPRSSG